MKIIITVFSGMATIRSFMLSACWCEMDMGEHKTTEITRPQKVLNDAKNHLTNSTGYFTVNVYFYRELIIY